MSLKAWLLMMNLLYSGKIKTRGWGSVCMDTQGKQQITTMVQRFVIITSTELRWIFFLHTVQCSFTIQKNNPRLSTKCKAGVHWDNTQVHSFCNIQVHRTAESPVKPFKLIVRASLAFHTMSSLLCKRSHPAWFTTYLSTDPGKDVSRSSDGYKLHKNLSSFGKIWSRKQIYHWK